MGSQQSYIQLKPRYGQYLQPYIIVTMPNAKCEFHLKNLPKEGRIFKSEADAYVEIYKDNKLLYTSETKKNEENPKFKQALFKVGILDLTPGTQYFFRVMDKNSGKDALIGEVKARYPFKGEYPLSTASSGSGNAR